MRLSSPMHDRMMGTISLLNSVSVIENYRKLSCIHTKRAAWGLDKSRIEPNSYWTTERSDKPSTARQGTHRNPPLSRRLLTVVATQV